MSEKGMREGLEYNWLRPVYEYLMRREKTASEVAKGVNIDAKENAQNV